MWQLHFLWNKGKQQEQVVGPLLCPLKREQNNTWYLLPLVSCLSRIRHKWTGIFLSEHAWHKKNKSNNCLLHTTCNILNYVELCIIAFLVCFCSISDTFKLPLCNFSIELSVLVISIARCFIISDFFFFFFFFFAINLDCFWSVSGNPLLFWKKKKNSKIVFVFVFLFLFLFVFVFCICVCLFVCLFIIL